MVKLNEIDKKEILNAVREHFAHITPEEFIENIQRTCPELFLDQSELPATAFSRAVRRNVSNVVGDRIRFLREQLGLTHDDVANHVPHLEPDTLRKIEESPDDASDLNLAQLKAIAVILKTTVSDLVGS